jgi:hypothetical protein
VPTFAFIPKDSAVGEVENLFKKKNEKEIYESEERRNYQRKTDINKKTNLFSIFKLKRRTTGDIGRQTGEHQD